MGKSKMTAAPADDFPGLWRKGHSRQITDLSFLTPDKWSIQNPKSYSAVDEPQLSAATNSIMEIR